MTALYFYFGLDFFFFLQPTLLNAKKILREGEEGRAELKNAGGYQE